MTRKGFVFDQDRCVGCKACTLACKSTNQTEQGIGWRKITNTGVRDYLSISCNHCDSPECFRVCPQRAFKKKQNGIVLLNEQLCNGCKACVPACPYQAPQYDPEKKKVSKCNFCYDLQKDGLLPACVAACHTGALKMVDMEEDDLEGTVAVVPGFPDISLTKPAIRFYLAKEHKRYWLKP